MDPTRRGPTDDRASNDVTRGFGDEPESVAIVRAVAESLGCEPLDLPPLVECGVDPEALDVLLSAPNPSGLRLEFVYVNRRVVIENRRVSINST